MKTKKDTRKRGTLENPLTLTPAEWAKLRKVRLYDPFKKLSKSQKRDCKLYDVEVPADPKPSDIRRALSILETRKNIERTLCRPWHEWAYPKGNEKG